MFEFQKLTVYLKAKSFHIACKAILSKTKTEKYVNDPLFKCFTPASFVFYS
jgi:hypothetical protein